VETMEVKEIAKFLAEPKYAYGELGVPGIAEPNTPVLFVVELVDYLDTAPCPPVFQVNNDERAMIDFEQVYKAANDMKVNGNKCCESEDWLSATSRYRKGIHQMERYQNPLEKLNKKRNDLLFILYINLAQCHLQLREFDKVVTMCTKALELPPKTEGNRCKAFYRRGKAEFELGHFEQSLECCRAALKYEPCNKDARSLYEQVSNRISEDGKEERKLFQRMFSGLTLPS